MSIENKPVAAGGAPLALASIPRAKRGTVEHERAQKDAVAIATWFSRAMRGPQIRRFWQTLRPTSPFVQCRTERMQLQRRWQLSSPLTPTAPIGSMALGRTSRSGSAAPKARREETTERGPHAEGRRTPSPGRRSADGSFPAVWPRPVSGPEGRATEARPHREAAASRHEA
jgi:hypothetical protein